MDHAAPRLMRQLGTSRRRPKVGDVFEVEFDEGRISGRVVRTDALVFVGAPGLNVLYFFAGLAPAHDLETLNLSTDNLLIPPVLTNNLAWSRGYFHTIGHRPLGAREVLDQHCFDAYGSGYFDEYGHQLSAPTEPVGVRGVQSFLTIEHELSIALGWGGTITA